MSPTTSADKMALFENLYRQFCDSQFTDLRLVSGLTGDEVLAHCLILASAVPPLGKILRDHVKAAQGHEDVTLLCPEVSLLDLRKVVTEIYCALTSEDVVSDEVRSTWAKVFGCETYPESTESTDGTDDEEESEGRIDTQDEEDSEDDDFQVEEVFSRFKLNQKSLCRKANFGNNLKCGKK